MGSHAALGLAEPSPCRSRTTGHVRAPAVEIGTTFDEVNATLDRTTYLSRTTRRFANVFSAPSDNVEELQNSAFCRCKSRTRMLERREDISKCDAHVALNIMMAPKAFGQGTSYVRVSSLNSLHLEHINRHEVIESK